MRIVVQRIKDLGISLKRPRESEASLLQRLSRHGRGGGSRAAHAASCPSGSTRRRDSGTRLTGLSGGDCSRYSLLSGNPGATPRGWILCRIVDELPVVVMVLAVQLLD